MTFGLTQQEMHFIYSTVVAPLEKQGAQVFCYGSRARGDHKKFSDLDLMVEGPENLSLTKFQETLQKSNFPYKVELVHIKDFVESYKKGYEQDKIKFCLS